MSPPWKEYDQSKPDYGEEGISKAASGPDKPERPFSGNKEIHWNQDHWEDNNKYTNTWNQDNSHGGHKNTWNQCNWEKDHHSQNTWNQGR